MSVVLGTNKKEKEVFQLSKTEEKNSKKRWIFPVLIALLILVFVTGILVGMRIDKFSDKDTSTEIIIGDDDKNKDDKDEDKFVAEPGMEVNGQAVDGSVKADVEIFKASYVNAEGDISVKSLGGDKVVAPGTSNSHKIKVTNTGNCALDYTLHVKDLFPEIPDEKEIPIEIRIRDYNGTYVVGGKNDWVELADLDATCDSGVVGKKCYVFYTLEWRWPFENGDDADMYDTLLGVLGNTEEIVCGITLTTEATMNANPDAEGGLRVPATGDLSGLSTWITACGVSAIVLILVLFVFSRKDEQEA